MEHGGLARCLDCYGLRGGVRSGVRDTLRGDIDADTRGGCTRGDDVVVATTRQQPKASRNSTDQKRVLDDSCSVVGFGVLNVVCMTRPLIRTEAMTIAPMAELK